jgi:hypothetical protein
VYNKNRQSPIKELNFHYFLILLLKYLNALILYFMGGFLAKLVFKSGKEQLKPPHVKNFFDFKVKDIRGKDFDL